jgi:hypothetical protein
VVCREARIGVLPGRFSPRAGGVSPMLCARTPVSIALFFLEKSIDNPLDYGTWNTSPPEL